MGFAPEEIDTSAPTRSARLKWVIVIDDAAPRGRVLNAVACIAAATSRHIEGLTGQPGRDADGGAHPGLPWAGCTVLAASAETLRALRAKGAEHAETFVADMPLAAQETRVYDEYLAALSETPAEEVAYLAVSLVGPRNRIDRLVGRLPMA
ncbi:DUF2000 domain-containing protein [Microbacterium sp. Marseille-Q6965]|uniref:DUF2000 domain-containing protein n=1 Tax=Microbacterium sp. Marseille-Q6965 TaxID=2965072 RepID=UPI0021B6FD62|nr:DUF2000 domain-containing protein [Microbacterium sp. Marseille-Q6965]